MEWIPRDFLHCCKERYIIKFSTPYFNPNDTASGYVVWYTYPNKKQESAPIEILKTDEIVVSESPKSDKPCAVSVAVQSRLNGRVVAYFTLHLLSLADYLFKKIFFPSKAITPEVVDPQIVNRMLAMFLAYYCNIGERLSEEQQADGILQTLLSQLKDHKGNLASITTGPYGTQENIIHFVLRNKLDKTAHYLIRNMRGYDHLFLEQDKNRKTAFDLAHSAGYDDLKSDIKQKATAKKPLVRACSNADNAQYENPVFTTSTTTGNRHLRKGVIKERYKHPGLLEILEVGDTVDVISGPDGGVFEVMIRDNHCFIPEVILWVENSNDQNSDPHLYEEIQETRSKESRNFYTTLKSSSVETPRPRVGNHYVVEPSSPSDSNYYVIEPSGPSGSIDERSPQAPPRSKEAKKPVKMKSAAALSSAKKSATPYKPPPYRPPPPKSPNRNYNSANASPTFSVSAPPRRRKSEMKEPVYEVPMIDQSKPVSDDAGQEYEECYVEPASMPENSETLDYLEICEVTNNNQSKINDSENAATTDATPSKENFMPAEKSVIKALSDETSPTSDVPSSDQKPNATESTNSTDADETSPTSDVSSSDQKPNATESANSTDADVPLSNQKPNATKSTNSADAPTSDVPSSNQKPNATEAANSADADETSPTSDVPSSNQKPNATESTNSADADETSPTSDVPSSNQKPNATKSTNSADAERKVQNLTITQAKKMFEPKPQSTQNSNKVTSPVSKIAKPKNALLKCSETNEHKPGTSDSSNIPSSIENDLPNGQLVSKTPESTIPNQETNTDKADRNQEENAVDESKIDDKQKPKMSILAKPNKPLLAKKPWPPTSVSKPALAKRPWPPTSVSSVDNQ